MDKITEEKLKMWQEKLKKLQDEYEVIMQKRGEAMAMGDLSENAAFQMLDEDASTYRVRIDEVKNIIAKLEGGEKKKGKS
jgi:transcription elongation GreA/GreB family factor